MQLLRKFQENFKRYPRNFGGNFTQSLKQFQAFSKELHVILKKISHNS